MKLTSRKMFLWVAPVVVVMGLQVGCIREKRTTTSDKQLFEAVTINMNRADVEDLLARPVLELAGGVYYGKPPKIEKWQSPPAPACILVVYSSSNTVRSKKFYGGNRGGSPHKTCKDPSCP